MRRIRCQTCEGEELQISDVEVMQGPPTEMDTDGKIYAARITFTCCSGMGCPQMVVTHESGKSWPELRMKGYETPFEMLSCIAN